MEDKQQSEIVGGVATSQTPSTGAQGSAFDLSVPTVPQSALQAKRRSLRLPGGPKLWLPVIAALLLLGIGVVAYLTVRDDKKDDSNASISESSKQYEAQKIDLSGSFPADTINLATSQSLSINGQLRTNNSLVLTPTDRPSKVATGQIYYDKSTNSPYIYNGQAFVGITTGDSVRSIGGLTGEVVLGTGLALQNGQLSLSQDVASAVANASVVGVTSLQGRTGAVNLTAGSGIAINGTTISNTGVRSVQAASPQLTVTTNGNGVFSVGTVGDMVTGTGTAGQIAVFTGLGTVADSIMSQSGGMMTVSGDLTTTGQLQANSISRLTPGQDFTITAGNDQLVFVSEGRTFQLPSSGAVNQTICTVGMDCATGGGSSYVLMQPGTVQEDIGAGASIAINNIGGGDLLRLQGNSIDRLVISNNGDTTITGNLSVSGAINGATVNNAAINGGTITGATINDASITGGSLTNTSVNGLTVTSTSVASSSSLTVSSAVNNNLNLVAMGTGVVTIGSSELQGTGALLVSAGGVDQDLTLSGSGVGSVAIMLPRFVGQNGATYTFDTSDSSAVNATICTSAGNCLGSGAGVGGSGTAGTIAVFNGTGFTIGDSLLSQAGGTVTITGDLAANNLQGNGAAITGLNAGNITVGVLSDGRLSNNVALYSSAVANFAGTLQQNGSDVCTVAGNCAGSGAGLGGNGTAGTIAVFNGSGYTLTNSLLSQSGATVTVAGDLVASNLQGNGSGVTNVNAALLGGQTGSYYLDASNISSGTLADGRLSVNVTMQGNAFNGANQLVQLDASGQLPAVSGALLTNLNASSVTTGTLSDARLSGNVALFNAATANFSGTLQQGGNDVCTTAGNCVGSGAGVGGSGTAGQIALFNGSGYTLTDSIMSESAGVVTMAGDLVASNLQGNGSAITNVNAAQLSGQSASYYLNASNLSAGTLSDARLSSNVTLQGNTFNGANQLVRLDATGQLPAVSGALLTNLNASSIASGTLADGRLSANVALLNAPTANFTGSLQQGGNDVCTTAGNCVGSGGGAIGGSGTAGMLAVFNGSGYTLTDSLISQSGGIVSLAGNSTLASGVVNQSLTLQGNGTGGVVIKSPSFNNANGATYAFDAADGVGVNATICTTAGNCVGSGGGAVGGSGTAGTIAVFNGSGYTLADSLLSQSGGVVTVVGDLVATNLQGDGSAVTNLNASSIASGTLADGRLSTNVALYNAPTANFTGTLQQSGNDVCTTAGNCAGSGAGVGGSGTVGTIAVWNGNSFTLGDSLLSQSGSAVTVAGDLAATNLQGNGSGISALNASAINTGTLADARLSANVTLAGNAFNGASQLVRLNASGQLPTLDASQLTNLNASAITAGTLADARLSANIARLNATANFTGSNLQFNGNDVCTTAGNCGGVSTVNGLGPDGNGDIAVSAPWDSVRSYRVGEIVSYDGALWRATAPNTSSQPVSAAATATYPDNFANEIPVVLGAGGGAYSWTGEMQPSTAEVGEPNATGSWTDSLWWSFTPAETGTVTINTTRNSGSSIADTDIRVYTGATFGGMTQVGYSASGGGGGGFMARLADVSVTANTTYYVQVLSYENRDFNLTVDISGVESYDHRYSWQQITSLTNTQAATKYISNSTTLQNAANINISSASVADVTVNLQVRDLQTADVLRVRNATDTTTLFAVSSSGNLVAGTINTTGSIMTGGTQRLSSTGALTNITSFSQTSGIFAANTTIAAINASSDIQLTAPNTTITGALSVSGTSTLQNVTVNGTQFTNKGSTLNTSLTLGDFTASGPIGTAATTVDRYTSISIAQTTSGITLSLPTPTDATAGRVIYVMNTAVFGFGFTMHGVSVNPGYGQIYIWNGTAWVLSATGGGSSISLQGAYDGGNTINTTDARNIAFTLSNTTTDANFITNIASGSTGQFKIQNNGTDILAMGSAGQLGLSVQGAAGGISIGGDTTLYRSGANRAQMSNALTLRNTTDTATAFQVQTAAGTDLFTINTASSRVVIGSGSGSAAKLHVNGGVPTWSVYASSQANTWTAITYGNGLYVAISSDGTNRVMTSTDGITWTARSAAASNTWTGITYGNGLFVAVSTSGTNRVMTSTDGITWTARTAPELNSWGGITYGNGLFVAVSSDGTNRVMTSPDGITWTARSAAQANTWTAITYGNGLFVAISNDGTNRVMTSPDGITWTARNAAAASIWTGITYGNGLFVAVSGSFVTNVMTSPDGITWTARTIPEANLWDNITYGNGLYVALALSGSNQIATSTDGATWTVQSSPEPNVWSDITYGNGRFVGVAMGGTNRVITSTGSTAIRTEGSIEVTNGRISARASNDSAVQIQDAAGSNVLRVDTVNKGVVIGGYDGSAQAQLQIASQDSWTSRTAAQANDWKSVTYGNGQFVAVSATGTNRVMTSPDGITWTPRTAAEANSWVSVTYGNGTFVAISNGGTNRVMTSPDGITWTPRTAAEANSWNSVTYGNGLFVAVSSNGTNRVMTSPDGITWTPRTAAAASNWNDVTYGNGLFVAVSTGHAMTSSDGITWTDRIVSGVYMSEVTYGNGMFVSTAALGTDSIVTSPDGITWTARTAPAGNSWQGITYGNGLFVAVSSNGTNRIMTSSNGFNWIARTAPEANSWNSVTYGNGIFVAVSSSGTNRVMTHRPGGTTAMLVQDTAGVDVLNVSTASRNVTVSNLTVAAYGALRVTGGDTSTRPSNPAEGTIYFDTTAKRLIYYANGQWKSASQVNSVVTVATQTSKGKDGADFVVPAADEAAGNADATIQAAIAALPASGGTVYLMDGTYTVDTAISIWNNTTFAGSGRNSTILRLKTGHNANINVLSIVSGGSPPLSNITVKDLTIDGNKANQTAGTQHGIRLYGVGNYASSTAGINVDNTYIKDMRTNGMQIEHSANSKFTGNYIMTNGGTGIYSNTATNRNSYMNNTVRDNTGIGMDIEGEFDTISNNHVQGNGSHGIDANRLSQKITNNTVSNNTGRGINSTGEDAVISGNVVSSNTSNGINIDERAIVSNNQIQSNGASGIYTQYLDNAATISNNVIRLNTGSGIEFNRGGANSSITGNTIDSNTVAGVNIYGYLFQIKTGLTIGNNYVGNNATYGISLSSVAHSSVSNNTVVNNGGATANNGIRVGNGYSGNINISGNSITDTSCTTTCYAIAIEGGRDMHLSNNAIGDASLNDTGSLPILGQGEILDSGSNTTYANQRDGNGNLINKTAGATGINTKTITSSLTLQGGMSNSQLPTPAQPTIAPVGASGTTTYGYRITALDGTGETLPSTERTITNAFATLDGTNYNTIIWAEVSGAVQYKIYRTTSNGTPASTGLIGTVTGGATITFNDTGIAATTAAPTANTTGGATIAGVLQSNNSVLTPSIDSTGASLEVGKTTGTVFVGTGTGSQIIFIGSNAGTKYVSIGSPMTDGFTQIQSGTGGISLNSNGGAISLTGATTVTGDSPSTFKVQDSYGVSLLKVDGSLKKVEVRALDITYNLTVNGHIISGGSAPTIAAEAGACTAPTVSVTGTDTAGRITVTAGSGACPPVSTLATITYSTPFASQPYVVITPARATSSPVGAYIDDSSSSTNSFVLRNGSALSNGVSYVWYYHVIQ